MARSVISAGVLDSIIAAMSKDFLHSIVLQSPLLFPDLLHCHIHHFK